MKESPITYTEYKPNKALKAIIANYWKFNISDKLDKPFRHIIPPDGCISLVFNFNELVPFRLVELSGAGLNMMAVEVQPGSTYIGARFIPGALRAIFDIDIDIEKIKCGFIDVSGLYNFQSFLDTLDHEFEDFSQLDQLLIPLINTKYDETIMHLAGMIIKSRGLVNLGELYANIPLSKRQIQRRFKAEVGVSPKEFCGLIRMAQVILSLTKHKISLTEAALNHGFYDQPHFIREVAKMSSYSPKEVKKVFEAIKVKTTDW